MAVTNSKPNISTSFVVVTATSTLQVPAAMVPPGATGFSMGTSAGPTIGPAPRPNVSPERTMAIRAMREHCWEAPEALLGSVILSPDGDRWTFEEAFTGAERAEVTKLWNPFAPITLGQRRRIEFLIFDACAMPVPATSNREPVDRRAYALELTNLALRTRRLSDDQRKALSVVLWSVLPSNAHEWMGPGEIQWRDDPGMIGSYEMGNDRARRMKVVKNTLAAWVAEEWAR